MGMRFQSDHQEEEHTPYDAYAALEDRKGGSKAVYFYVAAGLGLPPRKNKPLCCRPCGLPGPHKRHTGCVPLPDDRIRIACPFGFSLVSQSGDEDRFNRQNS